MAPSRDAMRPTLAQRLWWHAAGRDDAWVARRLDRTPLVARGSQWDDGARAGASLP
jgi:hypothetical protein